MSEFISEQKNKTVSAKNTVASRGWGALTDVRSREVPMQLRDRRNLELPTQLTPPQQAGSGANDLAQRYELAPSKPNNTGLPDNLTSGIESLSGMSMDHVKVHYHSAKPVQLNAHAYAQGSEIHVAPGQERHLAHEAWHVVQQARGRVKPTMQMRQGVPLQRLAIRHGLLAPGAYAAVVGWSVLAYATLTRPGLAPQHSTARSGAAGHAEEQLIAGAQALIGRARRPGAGGHRI